MKHLLQKIGLLLLVCSQSLAYGTALTIAGAGGFVAVPVGSANKFAVTGANLFATTPVMTVKGTITSDKGEPLVGASIVVKGTTNGTITDIDGKYSLSVPDGKVTLVISYVGYDSKEVALSGQSELNVSLSEGSALNEVIVVGYGTQKKSQTTGAISSLNSRQLTEMPVTSYLPASQGR